MIITKREVSPGMYKLVGIEGQDRIRETGPKAPGIVEGADGTWVLLLNKDGKPEAPPPDPETERQRSHDWVIRFLAIGGIVSAIGQAIMLMSSRSDEIVLSHEARAGVHHVLKAPPSGGDPEKDDESSLHNKIPTTWTKSE